MKCLLIIIQVVCLCMFFSCENDKKQGSQTVTTETVKDTLATIDSNQTPSHINVLTDTSASISTFGSSDIAHTRFPDQWQYSNFNPVEQTMEAIPSDMESIVADTSFLLPQNKVRAREVRRPDSLSWEQQKAFVPYYDFILGHAFGEPLTSITQTELVFSGMSKDGINFVAYSIHYQAEQGKRPLGAKRYKLIYLCTMNNAENIIDGIPIFYEADFPYGGQQKRFFIDEHRMIHLKYFRYDEEYRKFQRQEQWTIKPNGKIVRYYEDDGTFENREEAGLVVNHVRQGPWLEHRFNGFVKKATILEASFQEGEPSGTWKYFTGESLSEQEEQSFGKPEKGELLYTEIYQDGAIQSRSFTESFKK